MKPPRFALVLLAVVLLLSAGFTATLWADSVGKLAPGTIAPDFLMLDASGREVRLSDFAGKIVVLDFWATWCGPCIETFPHMQDLATTFKGQGVVVLAAGTSDTVAKFKAWIAQHRPKYPDLIFAFDPKERGTPAYDQRAAKALYGVTGLPTKFVIDREGRIAGMVVGSGIRGMPSPDARTEMFLAALGVKIDVTTLARGRAQVAKATELMVSIAPEIAAVVAVNNARQPFTENCGTLKAGDSVPDFTAQSESGAPVRFSDVARGRIVVLSCWLAGRGNGTASLVELEAWAKRYADQGVVFLGVGTRDSREEFDLWRGENVGRYTFPVWFDPAGEFGDDRNPAALSAAEKADYDAKRKSHDASRIPTHLVGSDEALSRTLVIDAKGRMVGACARFAGERFAEALGNLLLRAGIKLAPEDVPGRIWTAGETKADLPGAMVNLHSKPLTP